MAFDPDSVRLVLFVAPNAHMPDMLPLWSVGFSNTPQAFQQRPGFGAFATGEVNQLQASLTTQGPRLELLLASVSVPGAPPYVPLPDFREALDLAFIFASKVLTMTSVNRLALILDTSKPAADEAAAAAEIIQRSSYVNIPQNSLDVNIQYNLRKDFLGFSLNRVIKYGVVTRQVVSIQPFGPAGNPTNNVLSTDAGCGFTIDVNCVAAPFALSKDEAEEILNEIQNELMQIYLRGEDYLHGVG